MAKCLVMVYISADDVLAKFAIDSLNQLRRAARQDIVVKALFNPPGSTGLVRYYFFDGSDPSTPLKESAQFRDVEMTDEGTLTEFVDMACGEPDEWVNRRHCLIFWGHGTELLLDKELDGTSRYLTPAKLRAALMNTRLINPEMAAKPKMNTRLINHEMEMAAKAKMYTRLNNSEIAPKSKPLDIVAFDACSMSMIELASELQACAKYMIASQEDVPDASFPYEKLLPELAKLGNVDLCSTVPELYKESFLDYEITPGNGMKQTTLSSLNLEKVDKITVPLTDLVKALSSSTSDSKLVEAIISARRGARDFVLGIFVDLSDLCEKLEKGLQAGSLTKTLAGGRLAGACKVLRDAINNNPVGKDPCVIANQAGLNEIGGDDGRCHGISIYFPFSVQKDETEQSVRLLGEDQTGVVSVPLVKGTLTNRSKGTLTNRSKGTLTNRSKSAVIEARVQRIQELESDFANLSSLFKETGWRDFMEEWSVILADKFPDMLDLHYSEQLCVRNLLSRTQQQAKELAAAQEDAKKSVALLQQQADALAARGPQAA
jgi:hypothetical protein